MSGVIVQGGRIVWEGGFGFGDAEASIRAMPDTPYPVADLTQSLAATVLLQQCVQLRNFPMSHPIMRWHAGFPDTSVTVAEVLAHAAPDGTFVYDIGRFALLDRVINDCADDPYRTIVTEHVLDRLAMLDSVPGQDLADPATPERALFEPERLERYAAVLGRMAVPYRSEGRGRSSRSERLVERFSSATGLVTTARDLARFTSALDDRILLNDDMLWLAWNNAYSRSGLRLPTGLGWFVQSHEGEHLVWHAGRSPDGYSALLLKVPQRQVTFILLANSDNLNPPFALAQGDITLSVFARLFLHFFVR